MAAFQLADFTIVFFKMNSLARYKPEEFILLKNKCGIYMIYNNISLKCYVGSSCNLKERFQSHFRALTHNKHYNVYLQNAWNKHGKDTFEFILIGECPKELLREGEQFYLDLLESYNKDIGYNIRSRADNKVLDKEMRINISKALTGRKLSPEHKKSIADSLKALSYVTEEMREVAISMYKDGYNSLEIQKKAGFHHNTTLFSILKNEGIKIRGENYPINDVEVEFAKMFYLYFKSIKSLALYMNLDRVTLGRALRNAGVKVIKAPLKKELHPNWTGGCMKKCPTCDRLICQRSKMCCECRYGVGYHNRRYLLKRVK